MKSPIAREGYQFVIPLALASALFLAVGWHTIGWIAVGLAAFCVYFFRDPERTPPEGDDLIIAPPDGKVVYIDTAYQSPDHPDGAVCVSIFLSIFNVHVQRLPFPGKVTRKFYNKGKFLAAWDHKASLDNEQVLLALDTSIGAVCVKQIAGLVARRIVCWAKVGDSMEKAERFGLIRFGSRVDLIMPPSVEIVSKIGDTVRGGETVMARAKA